MRDLPRRRFGRTGLNMPVLSTGGMRYQMDWKDHTMEELDAASTENVRQCIAACTGLGINHIETARGYGTSEIQLGQVLPAYRREDLILQTKIGVNENLEGFQASFAKSMDNLKTPYLDLLAVHGINTHEELDRALDYAVPQARAWKRQGLVRWFGFSTHGPVDVLTRAVNTGLFDYINVHWYYVNDANRSVIQAAHHQDMGVFIISPSDKGGKLWDPPAKLRALCEPLTPMQFNDLYCLCNEQVHTLSVGAARPGDYQEHVDAMRWYEQRHEVTAPIDQRLRAEIDAVFGEGWSRTWQVGLPESCLVPGEVNVREIIRLYTYAKALDMVAFGKMRYNLLGQGGAWFAGNNAASFDEQAVLEALSHCPHADRLIGMLHDAHALLHDKPVERQSVQEKEDDEL